MIKILSTRIQWIQFDFTLKSNWGTSEDADNNMESQTGQRSGAEVEIILSHQDNWGCAVAHEQEVRERTW